MERPADLVPDVLRKEVARLAQAAGGDWCPGGGWQFPFDFGNGIIAPTYTETQRILHPWRRNVMLRELDARVGDRYESLSVLDLGAGEGAMAIALWERGVRRITCVEARPLNLEKARLVCRVFGADPAFVQQDVVDFLDSDETEYDIVLFMGLLYHLLDPFRVMRHIGRKATRLAVIETVLAKPAIVSFDNQDDYRPLEEGFFVRRDSAASHTAGLVDLELWPTRGALDLLAREAGFAQFVPARYDGDCPPQFAAGHRIIGIAEKDLPA